METIHYSDDFAVRGVAPTVDSRTVPDESRFDQPSSAPWSPQWSPTWVGARPRRSLPA